jgi:hypothetical protein
VEKLHNEEHRNLLSSLSIIRMTMFSSLWWAGHVARIGRRWTHIGYSWESQGERDH